jgi:hypothetical protein
MSLIGGTPAHVLRQEEPVTGHARPSRSDRAHITDLGCVKVSDVRPQSPAFVFFWKRFPSPRDGSRLRCPGNTKRASDYSCTAKCLRLNPFDRFALRPLWSGECGREAWPAPDRVRGRRAVWVHRSAWVCHGPCNRNQESEGKTSLPPRDVRPVKTVSISMSPDHDRSSLSHDVIAR